MYLVNESSKLEPVNRVYKIKEKSQSLLDHPRKAFILYTLRLHDIGPLGRSQRGGARGQNLELPDFFFFLFLNRNNLERWLVNRLLTL